MLGQPEIYREEPAGHIRQGTKERITAPGSDKGKGETTEQTCRDLQLLGLTVKGEIKVLTRLDRVHRPFPKLQQI